jgi:ABC-2 type transport system permease protein
MPIFDQGYQHWSGELTGHAWRWLAIARHGVRIGMKNWFLRIFIMLSWLPAIGLAFFLAIWGLVEQKSEMALFIKPLLSELFSPQAMLDPKAYRVEAWTVFYDYFLVNELRLSMILIMVVGPSLISQDLRFNALPLYFSRPLRRIDYFMGKLGVIAWFLAMVLIFPSLIAYVLGFAFSRDLSILRDTAPLLLASVGYGLIVSVSAGLLILALSSLSRNSRYIALAWLAVWFVTSIGALVLEQIHVAEQRDARFRAALQQRNAVRARPVGTPEEQQKQMREQLEQAKHATEVAEAEEEAAAQSDWRPMLSYTANLTRVGRSMLGSETAWRRFAAGHVPEQRTFYLMRNLDDRYPWYWSGILLVVLLGLSACILNFRVKSLDRLK